MSEGYLLNPKPLIDIRNNLLRRGLVRRRPLPLVVAHPTALPTPSQRKFAPRFRQPIRHQNKRPLGQISIPLASGAAPRALSSHHPPVNTALVPPCLAPISLQLSESLLDEFRLDTILRGVACSPRRDPKRSQDKKSPPEAKKNGVRLAGRVHPQKPPKGDQLLSGGAATTITRPYSVL
jgi:hypothetical protein